MKKKIIFITIFFICISNIHLDSIELDQVQNDYYEVKNELEIVSAQLNGEKAKLNTISQTIFELKQKKSLGMIEQIQLNSFLRSSHDIVITIQSLQKTQETLLFLKKTYYLDYLSELQETVNELLLMPATEKNITNLISINNEKNSLIIENISDDEIFSVNPEEIMRYKIDQTDSVEDIMIKMDVVKDYEIDLQQWANDARQRVVFFNREIDLNLKVLAYVENSGSIHAYRQLTSVFRTRINNLRTRRNRLITRVQDTERSLAHVRLIKENLKQYVQANNLPGY